MIVAAALWYDGLIFSMPQPNRHHDIIHKLDADLNIDPDWWNMEQGFIDDRGDFYTREAAYQHCQLIGQPLVRRIALLESGKNVYNGEELFSEDLW